MAIISIKNNGKYIVMPSIESAAAAVLYGKGKLVLAVDFSDGQKPVFGPHCPLLTYVPKTIVDGRFTFDTLYGWMYSLYEKVDDGWVNTYSGSFRMNVLNRLTDDSEGLKKYRMFLWPVDAAGLPLTTIPEK